MTVIYESGYTLPSGDYPLTHARIAHSLNWLSGGTATASSTASGYYADAPTNTLTYERWKPTSATATWEYDHGSAAECDYCVIGAHTLGTNGNTIIVEYEGASRTNLLTYSEQFDNVAWSKVRATVTSNAIVSPDGLTTADKLVEDTQTGGHYINQNFTVTSGQIYTFSCYLKSAERTAAQILTTSDLAAAISIDLSSGEVFTPVDVDVDDYSVLGIGNGWFRVSVTFTATSTGIQNFNVAVSDGSPSTTIFDSYTGDGTSGIYLWGAQLEEGTEATPYIKTTASSASSTWYALTEYTTLTSDEPIMAIFEPETRQNWRLRITAGTPPTIGVIKFGKAMQMERPLYGGHAPIPMARQTILRSNYSETGEYLGRVKQRSYLTTEYSWQHLTSTWVRSNWPSFQLATEAEPFWIAWRPGTFGDVGYCQLDEVPVPSNMGIRDLMEVSMSVRARGYE